MMRATDTPMLTILFS